MTSLRDPFSAVRKAQFEAQFDFFTSVTTQAFENASRLAALNLSASRDSVERSLGATFSLMHSRDPRDFLTLGGQAEAQVHSLFAYGRELLGIAGGVRPNAVQSPAPAPEQGSGRAAVAEQAAAETAQEAAGTMTSLADAAAAEAAPVQAFAAAEAEAEPAASDTPAAAVETASAPAADTVRAAVAEPAAVSEPVVMAEAQPAADTSDAATLAAVEPAPVAEPKAIARAAGKGIARAAVAAHPAAAPVPALDSAEAAKVELPAASTKRKK